MLLSRTGHIQLIEHHRKITISTVLYGPQCFFVETGTLLGYPFIMLFIMSFPLIMPFIALSLHPHPILAVERTRGVTRCGENGCLLTVNGLEVTAKGERACHRS